MLRASPTFARRTKPVRLPRRVDEISGEGSFAVVAGCDGYIKISGTPTGRRPSAR